MAAKTEDTAEAAALPHLWKAPRRRTMPNQRSKNKSHLGGFVENELHAEIVRLARLEGMESNKFGFVQKLIREAIAQRKQKKKSAAKG